MRRYGLVIFIAAFIFFLIHPFGNIFQIVGDNISQIAYWHILTRPHLFGSIGASAAKPGIMLILGLSYDVSVRVFGSPILTKGVLAAFAALLVYATARLTADVAGKTAGAVSALYLVSLTPLTALFVTGSAMIFFLPMLLLGLRFFATGRTRLGTLTLCGALLIRQEALGVLLWLAVSHQLVRREYRAFFFSIVSIVVTLSILFATYYFIYGGLSRVFAGAGPATGYNFSEGVPTLTMRLVDAFRFVFEATGTIIRERSTLTYLSLPALVTLLLFAQRSTYLSIIGIVVFWIAYYSVVNGEFVYRYFEFLIPLIAAFGVGGIFLAAKALLPKRAVSPILALGLAVVFMVTAEMRSFTSFNTYFSRGGFYEVFTLDAMELLSSELVPPGSRILTEDDVAYVIVARNPEYFRHLVSLQFFNIKNDVDRKKILASVDYIVIAKRPYTYYYLRYDPLKQGNTDPFRRTIGQMIHDGEATSIYGYHLTPIVNSLSFLVVRVDP